MSLFTIFFLRLIFFLMFQLRLNFHYLFVWTVIQTPFLQTVDRENGQICPLANDAPPSATS